MIALALASSVLIPAVRAQDFDEEVAYVRGLLELALIPRASAAHAALQPTGETQGNTRSKLAIEILETEWRYERDLGKRNQIFEKIKSEWQSYLSSQPADDDGRFQYIGLLVDHARDTRSLAEREAESQRQSLIDVAHRDLEDALQICLQMIEKERSGGPPVDQNEHLMKARYYEIDISYNLGLCYPVGDEKRKNAYEPFLEGGKLEEFAWDYEDYITCYYALLLSGQMKVALERYADAVSDFSSVLGVPAEPQFAGLRQRAYKLLIEALVESGDASSAISYADQMLAEYGQVWGEYWGEYALVEKARALADAGLAGDSVTLLGDIIQRDGPGKGRAQEVLDTVRNKYGSNIKLSCEVLYRASEGSIRKARLSERDADWFRAIKALHEAVDACIEKPADLKTFGIDALINLGHSYAQLDRSYLAALVYERGREVAHPHWGEAGWPEDADAADFAYYAYLQWKNVEANNSAYAGRGQAARDLLASTYPDSEQVKELVYYIGRELQSDARALDRASDFDGAIRKLKESISKFSEVARSSRKYGSALFAIARSQYEIVTLELAKLGKNRSKTEIEAPLASACAAAREAFGKYSSYLEGAPPAISDDELRERDYNTRWMYYYLGRISYYMRDFKASAAELAKAEAPDDTDFRAKRDYFILRAQIEDGQIDAAVKLYERMKGELGQNHPQVSRGALALAKHFDLRYLELHNAGGDPAEIRRVELQSARYFYDYAQSGNLSPDNMLNIGRKFLKVGQDYYDDGEGEKAEEEFGRAVWCMERYLETETDQKKRATVEEDLAFLLFRLGDDQRALEFFEPFVEKNPLRADAVLALAWIYVGLENYDAAFTMFGKLVQGLERYSRTWMISRYGIAYCLAKKNPSPEEVTEANARKMTPGAYLGRRGLDMIEDMRQNADIGVDPESKKPIRVRDPDHPRRRVRDLETLWKNVEHDLRKRK